METVLNLYKRIAPKKETKKVLWKSGRNRNDVKACEMCGENRWRTVNKRYSLDCFRRYKCRRCCFVRLISEWDNDGNV